ncbi:MULTISPECIES: glycosyltransferase family 9 protein [unclassified Janthinobacterium]|uniref:glycosyltransferase family 9 protein n=1 Tax=unclassified Janthinobacterium TaxID=2610881 RepID=UPI00160818E6|nr:MULTISPECIES: glycosyltransferase family 9 protein [unclassified Janthinobacterium]MBB5607303.1 ADP-heptose:LPS heptosyltransferase [Janthinobacterium sp. S3T4]MBB5615412.1 ADP-heptose:LPS heptosyltransferase [Janthinobacterium sp. S3M3]
MIKLAARLISHALLGKRYKQPLDLASVRKVLILRNDKIGDMIVSTPLLRELKRRYPHWQIDVAASSANRAIIDACPHVNDIIIWDKQPLLRDLRTSIADLRQRRYDVIFNPYNRFSIPLLLRIKWLGARYLTGFAIPKYGSSTARLGMFDHTVPCDRSRHILDSYFATFAEFKLGQVDQRYELFGVDAHAARIDAACDTLLEKYTGLFCLNFQGSNLQRTVSVADAQRCCAAMAKRYPQHALLVIAAPGTEARAQEIVSGAGHANVMLAPPTGHILELAALIRRCELVVSPDTSVIHLASVYDKKIVGYYIRTDNYRWFYPASSHYRVLLAPGLTLESVSADETLAAVEQLMQGASQRQAAL